MNITKEHILKNTSEYQILNYYLAPYHNLGKLVTGKNISNPFLSEKQETPSFNIYRANGTNEYRYKDFATGDDGSCFDLVMKLHNLSFPDALTQINQDLNLISETKPAPIVAPSTSSSNRDYSIQKRDFTASELDFWGKYGITQEVLTQFNVVALSEFTAISKENKQYTCKSNENKFIFGYDHNEWIKLYKPLDDKKYRFQSLGNKATDFIFGWDQLPSNGEKVFITGGEKDVMSLSAQGFNAITLNSETANLSQSVADELKSRFKKVIVLYDNDETGVKQSIQLATQYNFYRVQLPIIPNNGKDISDYFANNGNPVLIHSLIQPVIPLKDKNFCIESLESLIQKAKVAPQIPFLFSGIKVGSFGFVFGPSKSGKTIFCENLAMSIASGLLYFMQYELSSGAKKVFFISLEEYWQQRTERNSCQAEHLNIPLGDNFVSVNENFPRQIITAEDWILLKKHIVDSGAEVIFIDSLSRLYIGSIEESSMAKELCLKLRELANELKITLIVIHHCPKQNGKPLTIDSLAGSRMLAQEADFMIGISKAPDGTRYMKEVAFRYKQENDETVKTFKINDHVWLDPLTNVSESSILRASDARQDNSNEDSIFDYFIEKTENLDTIIQSKHLVETFVDSRIMSRPTLFANLKRLTAKQKIENESKGNYKLRPVNSS